MLRPDRDRPLVVSRQDLLDAAKAGVRIAVRARRRRGDRDDLAIRREVIAMFRRIFGAEDLDPMEVETLLATVQRTVDEALGDDRRASHEWN